MCKSRILLFVIFMFTSLLGFAKEESEDTLKLLSSIKGADVTFYNFYKDAKERDKSMEYAQIFLKGIDTASHNVICAELAEKVSKYFSSEKFLFSKAIYWQEWSLAIYEALGDTDKVAEVKYELSKLYYKTNRYNKSLKHLNEALKLFNFAEVKDKGRILDYYNLLGILYHKCQSIELSKAYFQKYIQGVNELKDSSRLIFALNNAAVLENALRDTVKATELMDRTYNISKKVDDPSTTCQVCLNSAALLMNIGLVNESKRYLDLTDSLPKNLEQRANYHRLLSLLYQIKKDYPKSIDEILLALREYEKGEFEYDIQLLYARLGYLYGEVGDKDKGFEAFKKYYIYQDKLKMDDMYIELFKYQNELIHQKEKSESLKKENKKDFLIFSLILSLIMVIMFSYIYHKKKKEQAKRDEQEIRTKKEILEMKNLQQFQLDKISEDIISKLESLNNEVKEKWLRDKIIEIRNSLKYSKNDEQWDELSQYVPNYNSKLYNRLIKDFPELTINERRLCVLLSMNLSTKEISNITRQSAKSINVARTRLRNKLGIIGRNNTIQEFLDKYN